MFIIELVVSFIVGGISVALLSLVAEKVNKKLAGIVLAFPTTTALGFFFLGWTLSPKAVAKIIPATFIPLGLAVLFVASYAYIARYAEKVISSKSQQLLITALSTSVLWFALAIPTVITKIDNLILGVGGYILLTLITHKILNKCNHTAFKALNYTVGQKLFRALLVGTIIFMIVLCGKLLSPFWGGMLTMFPAAFASVMMIFHWHYGAESLSTIIHKVPLGSLSIFAYTLTVMVVFPKYGFILGTMLAYGASFIVTLSLMIFHSKQC